MGLDEDISQWAGGPVRDEQRIVFDDHGSDQRSLATILLADAALGLAHDTESVTTRVFRYSRTSTMTPLRMT